MLGIMGPAAVRRRTIPEHVELRKHLVRERGQRHKEGKAGGATQDEKFDSDDHTEAIWEDRPIHLWHGDVDLPPFQLLQTSLVEVSVVSFFRTVLRVVQSAR